MDMTVTTIRCLLALALTALLAGCAGNHKFDDDEYRPLGDPKTATSDA
jgi:type IV pilus biogenesis protein CpaD/CtpE|tara:strand:+ start:1587 stop:1730 length:144 start_codon:yes stop_codon:yes gene_type:complete